MAPGLFAGAAVGPRASILDAVTDPGDPEKPNEDAFGHAGPVAWVIDGATGLGDAPLTDGPTDAAWLASAAGEALAAIAATGETDPPRLLEKAAETVAARFERERLRVPEHRYEIPTAAVLVAVFEGDRIRVAELGDTRLYVGDASGVRAVGGIEAGRALERTSAARFITPGRTIRTPQVLDHLRAVRARANTEGGYWVFAADPEPARRARCHELPLGPGEASALLLTDGLDALVGDYRRTDPGGLLASAVGDGLASLVAAVRQVERVEDPDCSRHPRFKPSDDATGLLLRIAPA